MFNKTEIQNELDMSAALKSPETRKIFFRIFQQSNLLQASFSPNDPYSTAYNEGLRAVGIWLKQTIEKSDRNAFLQIIQEGEKNGWTKF